MSGFQFRLQKVLELRDWREKEHAVTVQQARTDADRAAAALELLQSIRAATRERLECAHGAGLRAGEVGNLRFVLDRLDEQIAAAAAAHSRAVEHLDSSLASLHAAVLEKQSLERLRTKQTQLNTSESNARELKEADELTTLRQTIRSSFGGAA